MAIRARELSSRHSLILLLSALPIVLLIAGLIAYRFHEERQAQLHQLSRAFLEQRLVLDAVVRSADDRWTAELESVVDGVPLHPLSDVLGAFAYPVGRGWLADDQGRIIAHTGAPTANGGDTPVSVDTLPPEIAAIRERSSFEAPGRAREVAGHYLLAERLSAAPWTLWYVLPDKDLTRLLLSRLLPDGIILGALLAILVIGQAVLQRLFLRPAIALIEHVRSESLGHSAPPLRLPEIWRSRFSAVADAFAANRAMALRLRDEHVLKSAIVSAALDALITVDADGCIVEFNPCAEQMFGFVREDVLGQPVADVIVPPQLRAAHRAGMRRYLETGDRRLIGQRIETEAIDAGGRSFPIEITIAEVKLAERRLFTAFIRDISERKQADEALGASEERYRAVVEAQTDMIVRQRPDGTNTFVNDAYCRYMGMTREQLLASDWNDLSPLSESERERFLAHRATLTPAQPAAPIELELELPDGRVRWEQWVDQALFDQSGRVVEYQSVGRDITEQKLAEQALKDSEERFRAIAESVPMPIVITRTDEPELLFCNARAAATFGLAVGMQMARLRALWVDPQARERLLAKIARRGRIHGFEVELRRADGTPFWALVSARGMLYDGKPAMLTAVTDITERRRMEEALRTSEARLLGFMTHAPVGMYLKDTDCRYVLANPEMAKIFGRPVADLLGKRASDAFAPDEAAMIAERDREVLEGGMPTIVEEYQASLEAYAWSLVIRFPVRDASGGISHIGGFDLDITQQKKFEQQLEASRQHFCAVAEANPVAMAITSVPERRIRFANHHYLGMFGIAPAESDGFSPAQLYADPRDATQVWDTLTRVGRIDSLEVELRRTDGSVFPAMLTSHAIQHEGSAAVVTCVLDLTDKKRAEAEIERQRETLYQREKLSALGSLLAGVAHELNNPLAVVLGQATMLLDDPDDAERSDRLQKIFNAAERCARIVKTFLAMARQRKPQHSAVDLNQLAENATELLAYTLRASDVQVEFRLAPDLPLLFADPDQLNQVLLNLLLNAQQALQDTAPPRLIRIATRFDPERGLAVIDVVDNGPGVPQAIRPRIFEPFFTTKPQGVGTGIGLSVCHGMIEAHGGSIAVVDAPEGGALFTVELPCVPVPPDHAAAASAGRPARGLAVLVVDDELEVAQMAADILRFEGHDVTVASSGQRALEQLADRDFDLILCDMRMPDLDGPAFYRSLEDLRPELQRRLVFFTGDVLSGTVKQFLEETGRPCLDKPFQRAELRRAIEGVGPGLPDHGVPPTASAH